MNRRLFGVTSAFGAVAVLAPPVHAGDEWCEADPLVVIKTPGGLMVPVFVTNAAAGREHLVAVQLAKIAYTAEATGTSTKVRMTVTVPPDLFSSKFRTRSTVSTGALATGTIFATAEGYSGHAMHLQFTLDVS